MAYDLSNRFPPSPECCMLLDPGAYNSVDGRNIKPNKAPFLSNTPRITLGSNKIWTHNIYYADLPPRIPNCASLKSTIPRFPYEAFTKEDLNEILCKCGLQNPCECRVEDEKNEEVLCQANITKYLFIGHPPRSVKRDNCLSFDGTRKRRQKEIPDESPPFYDARINESTAFYQGCKWSKWTSKRTSQSFEARPGPADYTLDKKPTIEEICAERVRHHKRKTSKQLRFIEMIQQKNILEGGPGPASYSPKILQCTNIQHYGPTADRFASSKYEERPGPADYTLKRVCDAPEPPLKPCLAKLPEPASFGVKTERFKHRPEEGPSPASYTTNYSSCNFMHCSKTPFGSSTVRFKKTLIEEDEEEVAAEDELKRSATKEPCHSPTWEFKSKTIRMEPLVKRPNEPSPADLPQSRIKVDRTVELQYVAPFFSSEGRFQPWHDWIPVFDRVKTPGPAYYCLEKPRCMSAVHHGSLSRAPRFPTCEQQTPAPNEYNVAGGIETILATHNQRLKYNMENQHKFHWKPPVQTRKLSFEEQEAILLNKSIALLDVADIFGPQLDKISHSDESSPRTGERNKPKLLRCFLYTKQIVPYY